MEQQRLDEILVYCVKIPGMDRRENRDMLLRGLPKKPVAGLTRPDALLSDLNGILTATNSWGWIADRQQWAVAILLNNTHQFVEGTGLEDDLDRLLALVQQAQSPPGDINIYQGADPHQEPPESQVDATDIRAYCQNIKALHEWIPLMGFKTALRVPIRIEDIYVPLRAMLDERLTGPSCFADAADAEKSLQKSHGGCEISLPDAFLEAETRHRRGIVMLGDPGSGKTTHLKRVLLWCLRGGPAALGLPQDMIPVFLPLRDLKDVTTDLDDFIQAQLNQPHLGTPAGFGTRLLERGNLLFLLDGLDEVADTRHRTQVSRWIGTAMRIHQSCRCIVTCRFAGYTDETRLAADFLEMHIRPMTTDQAEAFVRNWYRIVETSHSKDVEQAEILAQTKAGDLIQRLQEPDFRARRVFELTRNPLLLTNICLVHLSRGNLPHTRAALYDECTEVLLERWRGARGIRTRVTSQTGRKVLQPAAYWLHQEEGRTRATAEELVLVIEPILKTIGWGPCADMKTVDLPFDVQQRCIDLLTSLPGFHHRDAFQALLNSAGLDSQLQAKIHVDAPSAEFFHTLVPTLFLYGTLRDGRNALKAVLESAKASVGQEKRELCQRLIQDVDTALSRQKQPVSRSHGFLQAVRDDSGLLTGWDQEHYGFMHLGFQEYLAAREIQNRAAFEDPAILHNLASKFGESWWQEVILLLLALDNPSLFKPFMREVVQRSAFTTHATFLDMCLDDAAEQSLQPFLDVLTVEPNQDQDLWQRQFTALQLVTRINPEVVEPLLPALQQHPSQHIRQWLRAQAMQARQTVITAEQGGYELVFIPGGVFMMGSPEDKEGRYAWESPLHEVQISDFYLGRYPVTNEQYGRFLADNPELQEPDYWGDRNFNQPHQPVVGVSWHDAQQYAEWAGLRLPGEAQWEYACRAGTTTRYYTGDAENDLDLAGWYDGNSGGTLHPVGEKEPNAFGLYDMHGNIWEWCQDWFDEEYYLKSPKENPPGPDMGSFRVFRGGAWGFGAGVCRSACRNRYAPGDRGRHLGFRLLRT